jgi:hypothetical protein
MNQYSGDTKRSQTLLRCEESPDYGHLGGVVGRSATITLRLIAKGLGVLAVWGLTLPLGGCGGIEFQGKAFDYIGLSDVGKPQEDVRMTERAPLLVPPNPNKLPPPGSPAITRADWPADTDKQRKKLAAARAEEDRKKVAAGEPGNPYAGKPNLLDKVLGRDKTPEADTLDVPEPDPTDKTAEDKARERKTAAAPQKPVDQGLNAPTTQEDDPFHPAAPDSYKGMSSPGGNNANY